MPRVEEIKAKKVRISQFLQASRFDGVVLSRASNFSWFTAGASSLVAQSSEVGPARIYYDGKRSLIITDVIEAPRLRAEEIVESEFEVEALPWHKSDAPIKLLRALSKGKRIASDVPLG